MHRSCSQGICAIIYLLKDGVMPGPVVPRSVHYYVIAAGRVLSRVSDSEPADKADNSGQPGRKAPTILKQAGYSRRAFVSAMPSRRCLFCFYTTPAMHAQRCSMAAPSDQLGGLAELGRMP